MLFTVWRQTSHLEFAPFTLNHHWHKVVISVGCHFQIPHSCIVGRVDVEGWVDLELTSQVEEKEKGAPNINAFPDLIFSPATADLLNSCESNRFTELLQHAHRRIGMFVEVVVQPTCADHMCPMILATEGGKRISNAGVDCQALFVHDCKAASESNSASISILCGI